LRFEDLRYRSFFGTEAVDLVRVGDENEIATRPEFFEEQLLTERDLETEQRSTSTTVTSTSTTTSTIERPRSALPGCYYEPDDPNTMICPESNDCWWDETEGRLICETTQSWDELCIFSIVIDKSKLSPLGDRLRNFRDKQIQSTQPDRGCKTLDHSTHRYPPALRKIIPLVRRRARLFGCWSGSQLFDRDCLLLAHCNADQEIKVKLQARSLSPGFRNYFDNCVYPGRKCICPDGKHINVGIDFSCTIRYLFSKNNPIFIL
jgi:hypothetical protein